MSIVAMPLRFGSMVAVQEKVHPGLKVALEGWLFGGGLLGFFSNGLWGFNGVFQCHILWYDEHCFARRSQAELLAGSNIQVLGRIVVLLLQLHVFV